MENRTEEWKNIRGFEGWYDVSSLGKVRGVERCVIRAGSDKTIYVPERLRKTSKRFGATSVVLSRDNIQSTFWVDDLVDEAFGSGKRAFPKFVVAGKKSAGGIKRKPKSKSAKKSRAQKAPVQQELALQPVVHKRAPTKRIAKKSAVEKGLKAETVRGVFKRFWLVTRGRKDSLSADGLSNIAREFDLTVKQVEEIVYLKKYQTITEAQWTELAK